MDSNINCPACGEADQVEKVSTLYVVGIEKSRLKTQDASELEQKYSANALELGSPALSRRLKPPASEKEFLNRPLHPDMVVLVFSIFIPFFLLGMLNSQQFMIAPVIILLIVVYGAYFWQRKKLIAKHERQKSSRQASVERVRQSIDRWMKLYYCNRDDGVFFPGEAEIHPTEQMNYIIMKK